MDTINTQIYKFRIKFGLSMQELADKIGVAPSTISYWEAGKTSPRMGKVKQLADIFNIDPSELIFGDEILDIDEDMEKLISKLNRNPEFKKMTILVSELTPDEMEKVFNIVRACISK